MSDQPPRVDEDAELEIRARLVALEEGQNGMHEVAYLLAVATVAMLITVATITVILRRRAQ